MSSEKTSRTEIAIGHYVTDKSDDPASFTEQVTQRCMNPHGTPPEP